MADFRPQANSLALALLAFSIGSCGKPPTAVPTPVPTASSSPAPTPSPSSAPDFKTLDILFVGNSFTTWNELPVMLTTLGISASPPLPMRAEVCAQDAMTLQWHWEKGEAPKRIREGGWDFVILQEQSLRPIVSPKAMAAAARQLDGAVREAGGRTVLYWTWARKAGGEPFANQEHFDKAFLKLAEELKVMAAPVGPAWQRCRTERPGLELYYEDGAHPTPAGSYLAACVIFSTITGRSPEGLPGKIEWNNKKIVDLPAADAKFLQEAAWKAVEATKAASAK